MSVVINYLMNWQFDRARVAKELGCTSIVDTWVPISEVKESVNTLFIFDKLLWPWDLCELADLNIPVIRLIQPTPATDKEISEYRGTWYTYPMNDDYNYLTSLLIRVSDCIRFHPTQIDRNKGEHYYRA